MNTRFKNASLGIAQATPPIWFMRQAGRYHSHYQKLRAKHGFMQLCKEPELAAEVALGPIEDFDFDLAILFSDLLFPLEALGMGLDYDLGPPRLSFSLSPETLSHLKPYQDCVGSLEFQAEAMRLTRQRLPKDKSLIGFVGGAWTLMGYAVEGSHAGGLPKTHALAPQIGERFYENLLPLLEANIRLQLEAGAEVVLILDTAAGTLNDVDFNTWVTPALRYLASRFPGKTGYYMRDASELHWEILRKARLPLAGIGFDSGISLTHALQVRETGFVQGNFNQHFMSLPPAEFLPKLEGWIAELKQLSIESRRGWICGLGHGCTPQTRPENVRAFIETVRREIR